jgi:Spy/CpxP family protein refolding chaperone
MSKKWLLVLGFVALGGIAWAHDGEEGETHAHSKNMHAHGGWCNLNLTDEQRTKMRNEKFKFDEARIDLEAQVKHAHLAYMKVLTDPNSDYDAAKSAAKELAAAKTKMVTSGTAFHTDLAFKILTAEQRQTWQKCHMHGLWQHRMGHGERFGMTDDTMMNADEDQETVAMLETDSGVDATDR